MPSKRVLCIAPHADDETLGVGATLAKHVREGDHVTVAILTGHGSKPHPLWSPKVWEVVREEARAAMDVLGIHELIFRELPAVLVPGLPVHEVNAVVGSVIEEVAPDVLYVPFLYDLHNDHRAMTYAASVSWRASSPVGRRISEVLMYETQSETHWNIDGVEGAFLPNWFVDVTQTLDQKLAALECYRSQIRPFPDARSIEAVAALGRWRGSLQGMRAAEAFMLVRRLS